MNGIAFKAMAVPKPAANSNSAFTRLEKRVMSIPDMVILPVLLVICLFIGWADYASGWELSLFIFYAVPITLAVWKMGSTAGFLVAAFCGVIWWFANEAAHPYETQLGYAWAMVSRLFYFGVLVYAVTAIRNKQIADAGYIRMLEQRRQLEQDIVSVSEYEQQRIGQDLHDGLCQHLAAIGCAARVLADELQAQQVPGVKDAEMIEGAIQQAVLEARNLARGIFPVHVDRSGLSAALVDLGKTMSRLTGASIEVNETVDVSVDQPDVSMHLYRIAQEAVANAVRHSGATRIIVSMTASDGRLHLMVEDNGSGIGVLGRPQGEGMGLRTMRYRSQALGADLQIVPREGGGTRVCCSLDLPTPTQKLS